MGASTMVGGDTATYEPGTARGGAAGLPMFNEWLCTARDSMRDAGVRMAVLVREHPLGSMMAAGAAGFLFASTLRSRSVPGVVRAAVGIAAAALVREMVEYGMTELSTQEGAVIETGISPGQKLAPD